MRFAPWPRRLGSQIAVLVLLAVVLTYAGNAIITFNFRAPPPAEGRDAFAAESLLLSALPLIAAANTAQDRTAVTASVNMLAPVLDLRLGTPDAAWQSAGPMRPVAQQIRAVLGPRTELLSAPPSQSGPAGTDPIAIGLPDGAYLLVNLPMPPPPPGPLDPWSPQFMASNWLLLLVVILPIAMFFAVRGVSRRLRGFARAAEDFSLAGDHAPLPETGPEEIRIAARSLNRMRDRIAGLIADRTRMLSAIGHDLRTPVTRLRLRTEFVTDADIRAGMMRDIARMEAMIDAALTFLRDGRVEGTRTTIDLPSLLRTICDEFSDMGADIAYEGPGRSPAYVHSETLTRAIENLVQNALRFGTRVVVRLEADPTGDIAIVIDDDGPGIDPARRPDMLKPFASGDAARDSSGGFGLGLSIAQAIAQAHGGALALLDSPLGGLRARITLAHETTATP